MSDQPPSESTVIVPPAGRCDFCSDGIPAWEYPARTFTTPGPGGQTHTSDGAWAACEPCAALIERNDRNSLLNRYLNDKQPADLRAVMRPWGLKLHQGFFANRIGPRVPTTQRYGFTEAEREGLRQLPREQLQELDDRMADSQRALGNLNRVVSKAEADWVARQPAAAAAREELFRPVAPTPPEDELPTSSPHAQIAFGEQLKLLRLMESAEGWRIIRDSIGATGLPIPVEVWSVPLRYGETFYWSREICDLIRTSAEQLDPTPWTLTREALPATSGFFYCERPVASTPLGPLRAFAWTLAFHELGDTEIKQMIHAQGRGSPDDALGVMLCWYVERAGRLYPGGLSLWRFGSDHLTEEGEAVDIGATEQFSTEQLEAILHREKAALATMLAFVQQKILLPSRPYRADRATRKMAERERPEQLPILRVVELRRRQRPDYVPPTEHRDVGWQVQWVVRGFWRNQWYPSLEIHQPRWIAPFWKGPADKPIKQPRADVFIVDR